MQEIQFTLVVDCADDIDLRPTATRFVEAVLAEAKRTFDVECGVLSTQIDRVEAVPLRPDSDSDGFAAFQIAINREFDDD